MIRNIKPIITSLNSIQVNKLNELGFRHNSLFERGKEIDISDMHFEKSYSCCGGCFEFNINISPRHTINNKKYGQECYIQTPYNSWWCSSWRIDEFTKDMESFEKKLNNDIKELRKVGIIK